MPSLESVNIVRQLFEEYYVKPDASAEHYASSHWRQLHQEARVEISGEKIVALAGRGFGDLQNASLVYRFFSWLTIGCYVLILNNRWRILRLLPSAIRLSREMGLYFTYDAFRQVCVVAALEPYLSGKTRVLNIGDGYGFLSALIKSRYPEARITCVDLGKTLLFQSHYCQKAFPTSVRHLVEQYGTIPAVADFVFCPAENLESLAGETFDLAINIASMQEMNSETVARYFRFLRNTLSPQGLFYCCNRQEKVMPGGEVSRIADYPWHAMDQNIWDAVCPWYRFFLSLHRAPQGPRLGNLRLPFVNYFDGVVRHRLVKLVSTR
jgi:SAM-dependent methyltransferase